jgi:hypothetical protein
MTDNGNSDDFPIFPSSPMASAPREDRRGFKSKYPWRLLEVGKSFIVPAGSIKLTVMQASAYKAGKRLARTFRVVDHGEAGLEVARLADPIATTVASEVKEPVALENYKFFDTEKE